MGKKDKGREILETPGKINPLDYPIRALRRAFISTRPGYDPLEFVVTGRELNDPLKTANKLKKIFGPKSIILIHAPAMSISNHKGALISYEWKLIYDSGAQSKK